MVDVFCGGGGVSLAMKEALDTHPIVAINHCPHAIEMHGLNFPSTVHLREDVRQVVPLHAVGGRNIDGAWFSPDCRHFSQAKGSKPVSKEIRSLAWVVRDWARDVRPKVIFLENVREFEGWGPLYPDDYPVKKLRNRPIPERKGETFQAFIGELRALGYELDWRVLSAHHYGSRTTRKRLYMVARCDGRPIVWPKRTHGPGLLPYRTTAEIIDWSIPSLSIFATREEAKAWRKRVGADGTPVRPLAEKTLRRIAHGLHRYVIDDPDPFIAPNEAIAPFLVETRNGERQGQTPRTRDIRRPLGTVTAKGSQGALVSAFIAKHYGGVVGHEVTRPLGTITATDHHSVVAAHVTKFYGTSIGAGCDEPLPTITGQGNHAGLVSAFLCAYYGSEKDGQALTSPLRTVTTRDRMGLVTVQLRGETYVVVDIAMRMLQPRELARAMGWPDDYKLTGTKKEKVARIGNGVAREPAAALLEANLRGVREDSASRDGWLFGEVA